MTEYVDGKKYRVTVDAVYYEGNSSGDSPQFIPALVSYDGGILARDTSITVERIPDPLPTAPGSVIQAPNGLFMMRVADGFLINGHFSGPVLLKDNEVLSGWTLIYDAGAK